MHDEMARYLNERIDRLWQFVNELEGEIVKPLTENARLDILHRLKETPGIRTRKINWEGESRLARFAYYQAFEQLKDEGKIVSKSHGRGHDRTWRLKEEA